MSLRLAGLPSWLFTTALFAIPAMAWGQADTAPAKNAAARTEMSFDFLWPAQAVPQYKITVADDGSGSYLAHGAPGTAAPGTQPITVSAPNRAKIFAAGEVLTGSQRCESKAKNLAQTGQKTLSMRSGAKVAECTFNYSEDKRVQEAVAVFQAIAVTMEEGPKLQRLHRFDRLGLDAELAVLEKSAQEGRALELENIAPVLRSLAGDEAVMQRVRLRASKLLEGAAETGGKPQETAAAPQ